MICMPFYDQTKQPKNRLNFLHWKGIVRHYHLESPEKASEPKHSMRSFFCLIGLNFVALRLNGLISFYLFHSMLSFPFSRFYSLSHSHLSWYSSLSLSFSLLSLPVVFFLLIFLFFHPTYFSAASTKAFNKPFFAWAIPPKFGIPFPSTFSPPPMGNTGSALGDLNLFSKGGVFTSEQLDEYQDCTFFTKKDILRLYKRFHALNPEKVPSNMQGNQASIVKLTFEEVGKIPELKENPFSRRICEVFSEDGCGNLTFDDFLDMFSVFSEMAPLQLKLKYAFRIYDFDGDEFLGRNDLRQMIDSLTRKEMSEEEVQFIIERIIEEADLDGDQKISQAEFEHVVSRSPDFIRTFHIRI